MPRYIITRPEDAPGTLRPLTIHVGGGAFGLAKGQSTEPLKLSSDEVTEVRKTPGFTIAEEGAAVPPARELSDEILEDGLGTGEKNSTLLSVDSQTDGPALAPSDIAAPGDHPLVQPPPRGRVRFPAPPELPTVSEKE